MPGENCCITGCPVSRRYKNVSLFQIPAKCKYIDTMKWRRNLIRELKKYKVFDDAFKNRLARNKVHICERHFREDQLWHCKSKLYLISS